MLYPCTRCRVVAGSADACISPDDEMGEGIAAAWSVVVQYAAPLAMATSKIWVKFASASMKALGPLP